MLPKTWKIFGWIPNSDLFREKIEFKDRSVFFNFFISTFTFGHFYLLKSGPKVLGKRKSPKSALKSDKNEIKGQSPHFWGKFELYIFCTDTSSTLLLTLGHCQGDVIHDNVSTD